MEILFGKLMDNLGEASEQRELTSDQVNEARKFFRDRVTVMKLMHRIDSEPAHLQLNWISKVLKSIVGKTKELTGLDTIQFFLTDDTFADFDNLMTNLDTNLQYIIKRMNLQIEESTNYFPCKIKRILHIQATKMTISLFITLFDQFFPQNCYLTSNLSTNYKTRLNVHTETIRDRIASAQLRLKDLYGLHKLYMRGPCSLIVDFVGGEEWRCSGGCNKVLDCSRDFRILDCCNHLYCGECYLQVFDEKRQLCPKCSSKVVVVSAFSKLKAECGEGGLGLYCEICLCAGGKKKAEASGLACATDVVSAGQCDAGNLVATVTETYPEPNLNVNYAEQSMN